MGRQCRRHPLLRNAGQIGQLNDTKLLAVQAGKCSSKLGKLLICRRQPRNPTQNKHRTNKEQDTVQNRVFCLLGCLSPPIDGTLCTKEKCPPRLPIFAFFVRAKSNGKRTVLRENDKKHRLLPFISEGMVFEKDGLRKVCGTLHLNTLVNQLYQQDIICKQKQTHHLSVMASYIQMHSIIDSLIAPVFAFSRAGI